MKPLEKAAQKAILPIENGYVFNDIYFGAEGLTSASASHISAMANVMAQDVKERVRGLRLYDKYIQVIGSPECLVEKRNNTLGNIKEDLRTISKANALIAWLREAIKEREACFEHINAIGLEDYCEIKGIDLGSKPVMPTMPRINLDDIKTVLGSGLTIKEYNRLLELNSTLAVYGEIIHERGLLTTQKKKLQSIAQNPIEVDASGRDTIITHYNADAPDSVDEIYSDLQAEYRSLQAEKNGLTAKYEDLAALYQTKLKREYDKQLAEYRKACDEYELKRAETNSAMTEWKKMECDKVAALRIVIPNDLKEVYETLRAKYL